MTEQPELEARVTALEERMEQVAEDAKAARHLAAANDRDLSEFAIKIDANRQAVNALGEQTAAGFAHVREEFAHVREEFADVRAEMRTGFAETRAGFAETRAGFAAIGDRLDVLIEREGDS